jgi:Zn finger protein HypA/HybF involved in hydrogenase expression
MSICVCAKCRKPWKASSSPARCPDCGEVSFAIAVEMGSQASSAAKQSAARKELWQNPEYQAK